MKKEKFEALQKIVDAARVSEVETGCPMELTVSQCILESGWLTHFPGNNPFGIKRAKRHDAFTINRTNEVIDGKVVEKTEEFAAFDSLADAFKDHGWLITKGKPYRSAWEKYKETGDVDRLIDGISKRYATDPEYSKKLKSILRIPEVSRSIRKKRACVTATLICVVPICRSA